MPDTNELSVTPETHAIVLQEVYDLIENTKQWVEYSKVAEGEDRDQALATIQSNLTELGNRALLTNGIVVASLSAMQEMHQQINDLHDNMDELEENFENRAMELANSMTESEIECILDKEDGLDEFRQDWLIDEMLEEGVDFVKERERNKLKARLKRAEDAANHELEWGDESEREAFCEKYYPEMNDASN